MSIIKLLVTVLTGVSAVIWQPDMETAKKVSKQTGHPILLNFSGSDWCGPCIRMRKDIFESASFQEYADQSLVLLNADFPRLHKNQLDKKHQKQNDELADKYNPEGKFPYTVLLNEEGKVLKAWEGYPEVGLTRFLDELKSAADANH